jgi:metallo-beta-lactamase class B
MTAFATLLRMRLLILFAMSLGCLAQGTWNTPFPPHRVVGNVHFIGSKELASYLVTTPQGHILINSDFESTVPLLRANVEKLGFKFSDIKIVLGSHAHGDHMEADALVKEFTGAQVMAMEQDVAALREMKPGGKTHPIDRVLKDGDKVTLGGSTLTAHLTAGHTAGCTSWTMQATEAGRTYEVIVVCSVGVNPNYVLVGDKRNYAAVADDYPKSFAKLRALKVDVFLGAHPNFYDMEAKYARVTANGPNPFVDAAGFRAYVDTKEREFKAMLDKQRQGPIQGK